MPKKFFQRKLVRVVLVLLACFVLLQFIRPSLDNPPVTGDLQAPAEVKSILQRACYDCHSNETKLAWFDKPVPAYWLVAAHVKEGRELLNFSHWDSLTMDQQNGKLFESLNQIVFKEMPLSQYTTFHGDARVSEDDVKVLRKWLASLAPPKLADSVAIKAAEEQYTKWTKEGGHPADVKAEFNGLAFMPDYKDWSPVSSTERWDNGTMRVIMGNPVTVKAIMEGHINPWPDGAAFAKVAWKQLLRPSGEIQPGEFIQVELMVKDKSKYAATDGWGFGRWKGDQLKPYGKDASFVTECMHCHQPMHDRDFVFTSPLNWSGSADAESDTAASVVLGWKTITSRIDKSRGTMSILYGNDIAVDAARRGVAYPAGARLANVTWRQGEDEHWYGANIPDSLIGVKMLYVDTMKYLTPPRASVMP
ncbi:MAG TPA: cytochrome P460 family protein [Puia sp.]|nr:cytochrome P460 family protein [Puia sp.]